MSFLPRHSTEFVSPYHKPGIALFTAYSKILDAVYIEHLVMPSSSKWAVQVAEITLEAEQVTSYPVNVTFDVTKDGIYDWFSECTVVNYIMYRTEQQQCAARRVCNAEGHVYLEVWPFNELCFVSCSCRVGEKCIITFEVTPQTRGNPAELQNILISFWCRLCEWKYNEIGHSRGRGVPSCASKDSPLPNTSTVNPPFLSASPTLREGPVRKDWLEEKPRPPLRHAQLFNGRLSCYNKEFCNYGLFE